MIHKPDLNGGRNKSVNGRGETLIYLGGPSLPFGEAGLDALSPDQQTWLLKGFLCAQEIERFRLGQELHDSTGQLLVVLRLGLAQVKAQGIALAFGELFHEIEWTVEQIEKEMRAFSFLHYPTQVHEEGLAPALEAFARGFGQRTGLKVNFRNQCQTNPGAGPAAPALLRVTQEALTNVYRHAHATSVRISLAERGDRIRLCIEDDGEGISEAATHCRTGVGLRSMSHRVECSGGKLVLKRLKRGTRVTATVPANRFDGVQQ
jgi:signal transduction histidine kinase